MNSQHAKTPQTEESRPGAEALIIGALGICAFVAVPLLYHYHFHVFRNEKVWMGSIAAAVGLPLLIGIVWRRPSRFAGRAAAAMLLACPAVYALSDGAPASFERFRDAFFLAAAMSIIFASAARAVSSLRAHRWFQAFAAGAVTLCGAGAVAMILSLIIYLE